MDLVLLLVHLLLVSRLCLLCVSRWRWPVICERLAGPWNHGPGQDWAPGQQLSLPIDRGQGHGEALDLDQRQPHYLSWKQKRPINCLIRVWCKVHSKLQSNTIHFCSITITIYIIKYPYKIYMRNQNAMLILV